MIFTSPIGGVNVVADQSIPTSHKLMDSETFLYFIYPFVLIYTYTFFIQMYFTPNSLLKTAILICYLLLRYLLNYTIIKLITTILSDTS